jgi:hypothetical protein
MDDNQLTADEAKYFETGGQAELPIEQPKAEPEEKAPAEAEKQPEAKAEEKKSPPEIEVVDDDDGEGEPDQRKYVKVGVLRREREQRKALKAEAEQVKQQLAALQQQMRQAQTPPREIAPEEAGQVALERLQQIEAQTHEVQAKAAFISDWQRTAQAFAKEQADFAEAYNHALGIRRGMYEAAGFSEADVNALLESEEASIVQRAKVEGKNPARVMYEIAQKLGYQQKAKEAPKADPAETVVKSAEKLAKIADGMAKNKATSGGGAADNTPTLSELVDMDDAEFDKMTSGKKWKEMMGG